MYIHDTLRYAAPEGEYIYIRQILSAHVITNIIIALLSATVQRVIVARSKILRSEQISFRSNIYYLNICE